MSKSRSRRYPSMALEQAIERIEKAYDADRQNTIDRETMAQHIGYSGISGASDQAIGTLTQYGLIERAGKGEMRVSSIAIDILHPEPGQNSAEAMKQAAFHPTVFRELFEKFPTLPSESGLRSYLKREGFLDRAVNLIAAAYRENWVYLEANGLTLANDARVEAPIPDESFVEPVSEPLTPSQFLAQGVQTAVQSATIVNKPYVFPFPAGGEASVLLPDTLTEREYEDFSDWLELMSRQAKRRVVALD